MVEAALRMHREALEPELGLDLRWRQESITGGW